MRNQKLITGTLFATMLLASGTALGQGALSAAHGPGVGVVRGIGGGLAGQITAASFVYDWARFRVTGFFGLHSADEETGDEVENHVTFGANFYYALHATQYSDFSLGGGITFVNQSYHGDFDSTMDIGIDLGAQIRFFLVPNVAAHANVGFGIASYDDDRGSRFQLTGDLLGGAGLTYFFR